MQNVYKKKCNIA